MQVINSSVFSNHFAFPIKQVSVGTGIYELDVSRMCENYVKYLGMGLEEKSTICSAWQALMLSGMSGMSGKEKLLVEILI